MPDFLSIIKQGENYNFHSHTQFCDGHATMAEFVDEAVRQGFSHYGFSPHSPVPIESPCNMDADSVPLYLDEAARLKSLYGDRINLYTAMEIDYLGDEWGPSHPYFDSIPLDYRIGSVHFIPTREGELVDIDGKYENFRKKMDEKFHNDIKYVVDTFYSRSIDMVSHGGFDIIGHLDKIGHNASHFQPGIESEPWYIHHVNELIDAVIESGITVEINTKAWVGHHRMFPSVAYWKRIKDAGATIIINSDAHQPALIDASRKEAIKWLDAI